MRVAHINGVYGISSTGRLIRDLVEQGEAQGIESRVYYSERHSDAPQTVRYITNGERNVHAVLSRLTGLQGYWSRGTTRRLLTMLEEFDPDVVHLHVVHGNCLHLPTLFAWLQEKQPALVITLHDFWWCTGRCAYPMPYQCTRYLAGCGPCPAKHDVCPSWFFDRSSKMQNDKKEWLSKLKRLKLVAVSDWEKQQIEGMGLPENSLTRIYNWIDSNMFYPRETADLRSRLKLQNKKVVLGSAVKLSQSKGTDDLLWLAEKLPEEYQVILVGQSVQDMAITDKVLHIPYTESAAEMAQYYSLADVYVNPSHYETFGMTTIEAQACGTPVSVYGVTASPELVGPHCGTVISFTEKRREKLLESVLNTQKDTKTSEACLTWVHRQFTASDGAVAYLQLYRQMTGEEKMKVAHINGVYGIASTGRLIRDIVEFGKGGGN